MNHFALIGRLTKDPELKESVNGNAYIHFTLAVNQMFKNKEGEDLTEFLTVTAFKQRAENLAKYCYKGSLVAVSGKIQNNHFIDNQNNKVFRTELIADKITYLAHVVREQPELPLI